MIPNRRIQTGRVAGFAIGLFLSSASAQAFAAGYQVSIYQSTSAAGGGAALCGYNHGGGIGGACQLFVNGTGSVSPQGGDGSATAASSTSYIQGQSTAGYLVDPSIHVQANTTADLKTATIQLQSSDTSLNNGYQGYAATLSNADISDTLHYAIAGADASTVTPITFSLTINGTMGRTGTATDQNSFGEFSGALIFGPSIDQNSGSFDLQNNATTNFVTASSLGGSYPTGWTTNAGNTILTYSETYDLQGASGDLPVALTSQLNCSDGEACDYSAKIGVSGPQGFSYSSASGVFLTAGGVPEPATWATMLVGFGGLGAVMRRRRAVSRVLA